VYGGASFVTSLIKKNLIDEFNLFITPTAIGKGLSIFANTSKLHLIKSNALMVKTQRLSKIFKTAQRLWVQFRDAEIKAR
jgi:dihydrofolate reductase